MWMNVRKRLNHVDEHMVLTSTYFNLCIQGENPACD